MDKKVTLLIMFKNGSTEIIPFSDTVIEKHKIHCHKNWILIDDVDINKMVSFGKKRF